MSDITGILARIEEGDGKAAEQLLPLVYDELRRLAAQKMAQEAPGQTLQATALVHEAYIRLVDVDKAKHWESPRHFFACAAEAMRRILVDRARQQLGLKRGGGSLRQHVDPEELADSAPPDEVVAVHDTLDALATEDEMAAEVVRLRYFVGFSMDEVADILGASRATVYRLYTFARAWLRSSLMESGAGPESSHF